MFSIKLHGSALFKRALQVHGKYHHFDFEKDGTQGPKFEMACPQSLPLAQSMEIPTARYKHFKAHLRFPANPGSKGRAGRGRAGKVGGE